MRCPTCDENSLVSKKIRDSGVYVNVCGLCQGAWFDADELSEALPAAIDGLKPPKNARSTPRDCPRCRMHMERFCYPQTDVTIEMCRDCQGIWLDRGEYRRIKARRQELEKAGELERRAPWIGVKAQLIDFIDTAIARLSSFD